MTLNHQAAQAVITSLIPDGVIGGDALRAVAETAIQRYVQEVESDDSTQYTFFPTKDEMLVRINEPAELEQFRAGYRLRRDWHEPDEQGINAYVIGNHLDNAMGPTVERGFGELNVVFGVEFEPDTTGRTFTPVAVVNLATLLSWATDGHRAAVAEDNLRREL